MFVFIICRMRQPLLNSFLNNWQHVFMIDIWLQYLIWIYIVRVTDKSGIFHLGHATDYEQKAEAYRQKTDAYIELESDPLSIVFDKVIHLFNDLRSKKHILAWQFDQMMPKRDKVALAYLYLIPKPHKVIFRFFLF